MILKIYHNKTVAELQEKFNECFPELGIIFFKNRHAFKTQQAAEGYKTIEDICKNYKEGAIEIKSTSRAEKVVHDFKTQFGLIVQLCKNENGNCVPLEKEAILEPGNQVLHRPNADNVQADRFDDEEDIRLTL